jgi:hypothetical protein
MYALHIGYQPRCSSTLSALSRRKSYRFALHWAQVAVHRSATHVKVPSNMHVSMCRSILVRAYTTEKKVPRISGSIPPIHNFARHRCSVVASIHRTFTSTGAAYPVEVQSESHGGLDRDMLVLQCPRPMKLSQSSIF